MVVPTSTSVVRHSIFDAYDPMASTPETVDFLCSLVNLLRPTVIVESGTYQGHAALAMGNTCKNIGHGHVWTADTEDYCAQGYQEVLNATALAEHVSFCLGDFEDMLTLQGLNQIDLAWIDASAEDDPHMRARHLTAVQERLSPNGLIVMDDLAGEWSDAARLRRQAAFYLPFGRGIGFFRG